MDAPKLMPKCSTTSKAAMVVVGCAKDISVLDRVSECCLSMLLEAISGAKLIKPLGPQGSALDCD